MKICMGFPGISCYTEVFYRFSIMCGYDGYNVHDLRICIYKSELNIYICDMYLMSILDNVYVHQLVIFVRTYREQIMFILSQQIKYNKQKLHLIYVIIKKMFVVYFGYLFRCCVVIIYLLKY